MLPQGPPRHRTHLLCNSPTGTGVLTPTDSPAPPYPPTYGYQQAAAPSLTAAAPRTSGFAVASVVLSLTGFAGFAFVGPILGVIFGFIALSEIKSANGLIGATAWPAVAIGFVSIPVSIVAVVAFFRFIHGLVI
jgi:hypothetical protein